MQRTFPKPAPGYTETRYRDLFLLPTKKQADRRILSQANENSLDRDTAWANGAVSGPASISWLKRSWFYSKVQGRVSNVRSTILEVYRCRRTQHLVEKNFWI